MKMEFDEYTPIFIQVINYIKIELITGRMKPGEKLPSVRELAKEFEINPNTVQKAYQELESVGVLRSERGSGNFITEDAGMIISIKNEIAEDAVHDFADKMQKYGYSMDAIVKLLYKYHKGRQDNG